MRTGYMDKIQVEQRYDLLVRSVVDYAIYMLDLEGRVVSWNAGAEQIKGYAADEIIGRHFSAFYAEGDRSAGKPERNLREAATKGRFQDEGWRIRKDGERFWAWVVIDAVRDDDGQIVGFAKITRDLTERRAAEQALIDSERQFRLLVDGVTDYAIYMLDPDGRVTNWNSGAQRIKGYAADEVIGQHVSLFYTPEDEAAGLPAKVLGRAAREGRYEAEGWRIRKDGERFWAHVVLDAIRDEAGELVGFAKVTRDITERKEAERALADARDQLFQAQKMEALGQLTGGLAHDFNNLLTAILGAAELASRHVGQNERLASLIESIRTSAQRGGGLTRQLLAFARRQPLETRTVDLREQLAETMGLLRHSMPAMIELVSEISEQLWHVETDPSQLELAILNLAFNARDAMPEGGTLRLSARNATAEDLRDLSGDFVVLSVADTGSGIAPELLERVTEPFFTTKGFGEGTGLGLSQVYGFAHQSGGDLRIESRVGEGSTIRLLLPRSGAAAREAEEEGDGRPRTRVLVVEDDPVIGELAGELLRELGYAPKVVANAGDALREIAGQARFGFVFSDVIMPGGMTGLELARKIRERLPELPILLTTGYSETASRAQEFPVLSKPYTIDDLARAVDNLLAA